MSMFDMGIRPTDNKYNTNKLIPANMTNPGRGYRYYDLLVIYHITLVMDYRIQHLNVLI